MGRFTNFTLKSMPLMYLNRWMIVWVDYEKVIAENLEPYLRKYCPEPEKVLKLLPPVFRPRSNAAAVDELLR